MGSSLLFFDILMIVCGLYLVYAAYNMKKTGEINTTVMVSKNFDVSKAKDKQGFIDYMYMKSIILGAMVALDGVLNFLNEKYLNLSYLGFGGCIVLFIFIVIYCKISVDAQKKYLSPDLKSKIKKVK